MNYALILAGGSGSRTGQDIPKQFLHIHDKPVIAYTLGVFEESPHIDGIVVVCLTGWHNVVEAYCAQYGISKLKKVVVGGSTRLDSIQNGMRAIEDACAPQDTDLLVIFDANRPLLTHGILDACLAGGEKHGICVPALPCYDWMLESDNGNSAHKSVRREVLFHTQTPEVARFSLAREALACAPRLDTDSLSGLASIMTAMGRPVHLCAGSQRLIKITTAEDFELVKALMTAQKTDWLK